MTIGEKNKAGLKMLQYIDEHRRTSPLWGLFDGIKGIIIEAEAEEDESDCNNKE